ncbi:hypothetical protein M758_12G122000 [Ceratodon purpureus]|nr:hypothetical protein M758_12G122000 [Ceratodon purpureus]
MPSDSLALAALSTLHDCSLLAFNSTSSGLIATIVNLLILEEETTRSPFCYVEFFRRPDLCSGDLVYC